MASVSFDAVSHFYPDATRAAVDSLSLDIADGEFLVLVGPSGCGKSTSLRLLAGLAPLHGGRVQIGARDVSAVAPRERDVAMVFQNYALYPHMTVAQNMAFSLRIAGVSRAERDRRVLEAAQLLGLEPYLGRRPAALSGGQRQRVAMGRAIVRQPQVFLMDEPLSNLDAQLRVQTRAQISALQRRLGVTTLYVTHDQTEALTMGDRIAVLHEGRLQQVGTPRELYDAPANVFTAGFIGSPAMNLVPTRVLGDQAWIGALGIALAPSVLARLPAPAVTVGVRPEDLRVLAEDGPGGLDATVERIEALGSDSYLHTTSADPRSGEAVRLVSRVGGRHPVRVGDTLRLAPDVQRLHLFDTASGRRL